ncbi:pentapeptide repeat-containing protein [Spirosoma gilvum]
MLDPTQLQVKKPLAWYNRILKVDFKKLFVSLSKSLLYFKYKGVTDGTKEFLDSISAFDLKKDPSGLAYMLILKAMLNSANDLVIENRNHLCEGMKTEDELYKNNIYMQFLDEMNDILESKELTIDLKTLENPRTLSILPDFCNYFEQWLVIFGLDKFAASTIVLRLPSYFVLNLNEEWRTNSDYALILQNINTPITEAARREIEWRRYNSFLQQQIDQPIFEESFSLRQIYVELRAYSEIRKSAMSNSTDIDDISKEKHIHIKRPFILKEELNGWLLTNLARESIKFLSGGPGSGKSSFVKMWAAEVSNKQQIRTIFIPLHLFDIQNDIIESIGRFVQSYSNINLSYNPIEKISEKILIIFDGLDELSQQGKYAMEVAGQFIDALSYISNIINNDYNIKALFLVVGRELSIQNNTQKFRLDNQIIHLLPYYIRDISDWEKLTKEQVDLLKLDQRNIWWNKYSSLIGEPHNSMPKELNIERLEEITAQPLLNYLVALSLKRGKIEFSRKTNLNDIYADLIEGVHERAYEQHRRFKPIEILELSDFKRMLEEIALSAWHGGDVRTTSVKKIELHIQRNDLGQLLAKFKEEAKSGIVRLLTAFYFRQHGLNEGEQTFEFTHKSFGEYLTASRLVKQIFRISKQLEARLINYDEGWNEEKALEVWFETTSESSIDEYLRSFIIDEIVKYDKAIVRQCQKNLAHLISWVLQNGLPVARERKSHNEEIRLVRNTNESLLILLNSCALYTEDISIIKTYSQESFSSWIRSLQMQRIGPPNVVGYRCLSFIKVFAQDKKDLQLPCIFHLQDLYSADISHSDFRGSQFQISILMLANLSYSNFSEANFLDANLTSTKLIETDLRHSVLKGANLMGANLTGADLADSNLIGANLAGANLTETNLAGANLMGVIFKFKEYSPRRSRTLITEGISYEQLEKVKSLSGAIGIPSGILARLRKEKPHIFESESENILER